MTAASADAGKNKLKPGGNFSHILVAYLLRHRQYQFEKLVKAKVYLHNQRF